MQYWGMTFRPKPKKIDIQFKENKNKNYEWHEQVNCISLLWHWKFKITCFTFTCAFTCMHWTDTHWVHVGTLSKDHNVNAINLNTGRNDNLLKKPWEPYPIPSHEKKSIKMPSITQFTLMQCIFLAKTYSPYMGVPSPRWVFPPNSICIACFQTVKD